MSDRPAETEYSAALQALMQIRTNASQGENTGGETGVTSGGVANANHNENATTAAQNANSVAALLRMGASPASLLQHPSFTPSQIAAVRAAAAASLNRNGYLQAAAMQNASFAAAAASAARSDFASNLGQHYTNMGAMARDPRPAAAATSPLPPSLTEMPQSPAVSPSRPATARNLPASAAGAAKRPTTPATLDGGSTDDGGDEAEAEKIRREEVEAALRSKPQRGRKRENLNAKERLELTRTRNREHAKSTRVRKKARYQELLDAEQKFLAMQHEDETNSQRREAVLNFLDARAQMLTTTFAKRNFPSVEEKVQASESSENDESAERGDSSSPNKSKCKAKAEDEVMERLQGILENVKTFRFETSLDGINVDACVAMAQFDDFVSGRVESLLIEHSSSCRLKYRVVGLVDGIALNKDGSGFARVELVASNSSEDNVSAEAAALPNDNEKIVQTSVVSFEFAGMTPLISAVSWCILRDAADSPSSAESVNEGKSDCTAKESLESQTVYPSVVSFDETHRVNKSRESSMDRAPQGQHENGEHSEENPGMSI